MAAASLDELHSEAREGGHSEPGASALIVCDRLVRIYQAEGIEVQALQGLDLVVERSELTALVGASGSGKSTLVNILAGLDTPTAGSVRVGGHDLAAMSARQRLAYRRSTVGFIWQQTSRNLLPYLTAAQNVDLPMKLAGQGRKARHARGAELLEALGVAHCTRRRPDQMSGGEQQRVAIATAIANKPSVLLADEPTGELDSVTAESVFAALKTANTHLGVTVLVVTHDPGVSSNVRRVIAIRAPPDPPRPLPRRLTRDADHRREGRDPHLRQRPERDRRVAWAPAQASSPAASSSAWPSPALSRRAPGCCLPTSPPGNWTPIPASRSCA
jgi:ABC-type lipoprotein export system ATPase subunit